MNIRQFQYTRDILSEEDVDGSTTFTFINTGGAFNARVCEDAKMYGQVPEDIHKYCRCIARCCSNAYLCDSRFILSDEDSFLNHF